MERNKREMIGATRVPVFVLAAQAQVDDELFQALEKHLLVLQHQGLIELGSRHGISPGIEWQAKLENLLRGARMILLLVSPDFLADDHLYHHVLPLVMQLHDDKLACVLPILLRPVEWQGVPFQALPILPGPSHPVTTWQNRDEAFHIVARQVRQVAEQLQKSADGPLALPYNAILQRPQLFMAVEMPADFVPRPTEFNRLKRHLMTEQAGRPAAITAALRGAGGYGKTTLALALCHDPEIQAHFPDGILWVTLGEKPVNLIDKIAGLISLLTYDRVRLTSLEEAITRLRQVLSSSACLLVIDDVWQVSDLEPFLHGGAQCARLITTRNELVLPARTTRIPVDAMRSGEAIQLLQKGLLAAPLTRELEEAFESLATRLGEWPLLLTLAGGVLRRRVRQGEALSSALKYVHLALDKRGVLAFDANNAESRKEAVARTLAVSLEQLKEEQIARYEELATFPEDAALPLITVQRLWQATANLDAFETEELCQHLSDLSLLLSYDLSNRHIMLHDVVHGYLQRRAQARLPSLHACFLDAYGLQRWADLSPQEPYLWDHLARHLLSARQPAALISTVKDLHYLCAKILARGVAALEQDLLLATACAPADDELHTLTHAMARFAHLLQRGRTLSEIQATLTGHILGIEPLKTLYDSWQHELTPLLLTASAPLPDLPDAALLRTFAYNSKFIRCTFSPNGSLVLACSRDGLLTLWDVRSGAAYLTLKGHSGAANCGIFSPDGSQILSCSRDGTLRLWDARSGKARLTIKGHSRSITSCAFSPDCSLLLSGSADTTLRVWDAHSGEACFTLTGHSDYVTGCAFSPDGSQILSCSADRTLRLWDARSGEPQLILQSHTALVFGCAFSPDGSQILSCSLDRTLKLWDASAGKVRISLKGHGEPVRGCAFSPDGSQILSCSEDRTLKLWSTYSSKAIQTFSGHTRPITGCAFSPDGSQILSCSDDSTFKLWDARTRETRPAPNGHTDAVTGCAFSPDGSQALSSSLDRTLRLWDAHSGKVCDTFGHPSRAQGCAFSPDGSSILSYSRDSTLKLRDAHSGKRSRTLVGHTRAVTSCTFSLDSSLILSCSEDSTLRIWDACSGHARLTLKGHTDAVRGGAFCPDASMVLSCSDDRTLKLWDARSGETLLTLAKQTARVTSCAFSPDGFSFLSGCLDGNFKLWDTFSGEARLTLTGHNRAINGCAFSPDGSQILSCSDDGSIRLWNATGGQCLTAFFVEDALSCCAFHPAGNALIVGGQRGVYFLRIIRE